MAISPATITRNSVLAGLNNTQRGGTAYCATCGRAAQITQGAFSGNYTGRGTGSANDSYFCATCNGGANPFGNVAARNNTTNTYGRTNNGNGTSYGTCATCNQAHASSAPHWSGSVAGSQSGNSSYSGLSWVR